MRNQGRLPTIPELVQQDVQGFARAWWKQPNLAESGLSLAQVVLEYQFAICAHIVGRLKDPLTPAEVKDAYAMRGLPNLGVVLKSADATLALSAGQPAPPPASAPETSAAAPNVSSVLEAYRTAGKLPQ